MTGLHQKRAIALHTVLLGTSALGAFAILGCHATPPKYSRLDNKDVGLIHWAAGVSETLGTKFPETPHRLNDVAYTEGEIFALDGQRNRVLVYSRDGRLKRSFGSWGDGVGQFKAGRHLTLWGDSLLVPDATRSGALVAFKTDGTPLAPITLPSDKTTLNAARTAIGTVIRQLEPDTSGGMRTLVSVLDRTGRQVGRGCPQDRRYLRYGSMMASFAIGDIAIGNGTILCTQPISPIIDVLRPDGSEREQVRLAPPFYRDPPDIEAGQTSQAREAFRAQATLLSAAYPLRNGFLAVYALYDTTRHRPRELAFSCTAMKMPAKCAIGEVPGRVIGMVSPDTILVSQTASATGLVIVSRYHVGM